MSCSGLSALAVPPIMRKEAHRQIRTRNDRHAFTIKFYRACLSQYREIGFLGRPKTKSPRNAGHLSPKNRDLRDVCYCREPSSCGARREVPGITFRPAPEPKTGVWWYVV
jgi:hypothetical protein